jgi:hypothetical protein
MNLEQKNLKNYSMASIKKWLCKLGLHDWSYKEEDYLHLDTKAERVFVFEHDSKQSVRLCERCFKKQILTHKTWDSSGVYISSKRAILTKQELREKHLKELLND